MRKGTHFEGGRERVGERKEEEKEDEEEGRCRRGRVGKGEKRGERK